MNIQIAEAVILASTLILSLGEPKSVPISGNQIWISDPKIVEAQALDAHKALLIGKSLGEVYLYGLPAARINRAIVTTPSNLRALKRCPAVQSDWLGASDGSLRIEAWTPELAHLIQKCGFDRLSVQNISSLGTAINLASTKLKSIGLSAAQATSSEGRLTWNIETGKTPSLRAALGELAAFSDFTQVSAESQNTIVFKLDLFEFSSSEKQSLNFNGSPLPSLATGSIVDSAKLSLIYDRAKQAGRLIASPQLRTTPGKTATFNSGGEIPIQDAQFSGTKTVWKAYGLKVMLTPTAQSSPLWPEVSTKLEIEYIQPDFGSGDGKTPAMITRNLSNDYSLPMSQTTLLTSMLYSQDGNTQHRNLGLGAIPLIGSLFQNSSSHQTQSELWFLITPTWATPPTPTEIPRIWDRYGKIR